MEHNEHIPLPQQTRRIKIEEPEQNLEPEEEQNLEPEQEQSPTKTTEIRLLSQGAYGCVFKPNITCDGSTGNNRYVSKIQNNDDSIQNELNIGKKISSIDKFHMFFAPILESCPVSLNSIGDSEIKNVMY